MEAHVRFLGLLNLAYGVLGGLASAFYLVFFADYRGLDALGILGIGWMCALLATAIPSIASGIGLLLFQPWGRNLAMITAIVEQLTFPLGTAVGLYAIWVLLSAETDPLFNPRYGQTALSGRPGRKD